MSPVRPRLLAFNAGWLASGEMVNRLLGFLITLYLARVLGASLFGAVGVAVGLVAFLGVLVRAGTAAWGIREIAVRPNSVRETYGRLVGIRIAIAVAFLVPFTLAAPLVAKRFGVPADLMLLYGFALIPAALTLNWAFRGLERMHVVGIAMATRNGLVLVGLLLFVRAADADATLVPVIEVAAALMVIAGLHWLLRRRVGPLRPRFEIRLWPGILREAVPIGIGTVMRTVFMHGEVILLGWLATTAAAGQYLVSHKIVLALALLGIIVQESAFPATSRIVRDDVPRALALQARLLRYTFIVLAPVCVTTVAHADALILLLYGPVYAKAAEILRITALALPFAAAIALFTRLLIAAAAPRALVAGIGIGAAAHVALGIALIPAWQEVGAAVACVGGEAIGAIALAVMVHRVLAGGPWDRRVLAPVVGGIAMAAAFYLARGWDIPYQALAGLAVYALVATVFGAVRRDEIRAATAFLVGTSGR